MRFLLFFLSALFLMSNASVASTREWNIDIRVTMPIAGGALDEQKFSGVVVENESVGLTPERPMVIREVLGDYVDVPCGAQRCRVREARSVNTGALAVVRLSQGDTRFPVIQLVYSVAYTIPFPGQNRDAPGSRLDSRGFTADIPVSLNGQTEVMMSGNRRVWVSIRPKE